MSLDDSVNLSRPEESEISLVALWEIVWSHKYIVAGAALVGAIIAAVLALTAVPMYRAEVVVTEVKNNAANGAAALASQFGGLARLAGVNLGGGDTGNESQAVLQSRRLAQEFVKRNDIIEKVREEGEKAPTLWIAVNRFRKNVLSIRPDKRTGMTTITVSDRDPAQAAAWANGYVALANELLRTRALDQANDNIAYLTKQISTTNVVELQRVMYNLVENETKTLMLASGKAEYAFTIIDPAVPPELRFSPRRTVMVLTGTMIGLFLGVIIASLLRAFRKPGEATTSGRMHGGAVGVAPAMRK